VVVEFRSESVAGKVAALLLEEYFAYRAHTFPVANGYRAASPDEQHFCAPRGDFVVAFETSETGDGSPLGCGGIRDLGEGRWELKHLWMREAARGRGFGKRMLVELERRAKALGARELVLDTHASLTAAGSLYRAAGFANIEPYNDNANATDWMLKQL
jgi:ribosomal protein S18 acetylase RimI-like enzyme